MFKKQLQYMMSNNEQETLSIKGSEVRKKLRPFFMSILKVGNKLKLVVEKREFKKVDRPIIYVASHGFKDDVLNTVLTLKDDAYVVFGNIDLFYNTFDGFCLWVYGVQLVDRYDKSSKHAMKEKMNRVIKLGNNVVIFSEASWNLSPNKLMERLHWGFYDVAISNDALIVPVVTHKVGKTCYSRVLESIDLNNIGENDIKEIYSVMKKYITKAKDLMIYDSKKYDRIKLYLNHIERSINEILNLESLDKAKLYINNIEEKTLIFADVIREFKDEMNDIEVVELSALDLVIKLVSRIGFVKKEVMVSKIRDIMALEKYEMIKAHPDNSYIKNSKDIYDAWDKYIKDTITATPYFYLEKEKTTLCKDPLIVDEEEVMSFMKVKKI